MIAAATQRLSRVLGALVGCVLVSDRPLSVQVVDIGLWLARLVWRELAAAFLLRLFASRVRSCAVVRPLVILLVY